MALDPNLRPYEVLATAIRSEIDAANFYSKILDRVKNILLQHKLKFLVLEEKKHSKILEKLFSDRFPDRQLQVPEKAAGPPLPDAVDEQSNVLDLFKAALEAEKYAEEFYANARKTAGDAASKKMLEYLSRVERSHYFLIRAEIDLLSRFPDYYDVEDFHLGQDLFHIGP